MIRVPFSHLYRGLHLRAVCEVGAKRLVLKEQQDIDVLLLFEDGSYASADLVYGEDGRPALQVAAYTTARGTSMGTRTWTVTRIEECDDGLEIRLGYAVP